MHRIINGDVLVVSNQSFFGEVKKKFRLLTFQLILFQWAYQNQIFGSG